MSGSFNHNVFNEEFTVSGSFVDTQTSSDQTMNSKLLSNNTNVTDSKQFTPKSYVDALVTPKLNKSGDAVTGHLTSNQTSFTANDQLVTKQYVDTQDGLLVAKAGSSLTGHLTSNQTSFTANDQLVTKQYVDSQSTSFSGTSGNYKFLNQGSNNTTQYLDINLKTALGSGTSLTALDGYSRDGSQLNSQRGGQLGSTDGHFVLKTFNSELPLDHTRSGNDQEIRVGFKQTSSSDDGKFLKYVHNGVPTWDTPAGSSGATSFTGLTDTPSNFTNQAGMVLQVNSSNNGVEFTNPTLQDEDDGVSGAQSIKATTHSKTNNTVKMLAPGTNVTFDTSDPNTIKINSSGSGSGGTTLTAGSVSNPHLVWNTGSSSWVPGNLDLHHSYGYVQSGALAGYVNKTADVKTTVQSSPSTGDVYACSYINALNLFDGNYNSLSNKPSLGAVATSNSYNDLSNLPTIPSAQVRSDWTATTGISVIENKPSLFDGNYNSLSNKPTIPSAQVRSDWTATTGISVIENKPSLFDGNYNSLSNKPSLGAVATSNSYNDLSNLPAIPSAQVRSDWTATTGISVIENKPSLFDGNYNSLSNKPTLLSLTPTTNRTTNYVLKYNGTDVAWGADATSSGGSSDGVLSNLAISSTGLLTATLSNGNTVTEQIDTDKLGWKVYPQTSDLPTASNHHGMLAHVHSGGVIYFAHNGSWVKLANYSDLVQSDWNSTSGLSQIANKPTLFDGNYNSLSNKPSLGAVATSNSYNDLSNLPTIPSAQVRSDWTATTGISVIENKPTLFDGNYNSLSNKPTITSFPSYTTVSNAGQIFFVGDGNAIQVGSKDAYTFATDRLKAELTTTRYYTQSSSPYTYSNQQTTVNLLPALSASKFLYNDGTNLSWATVATSTDTYVSSGQVNSGSQLVLTKSDGTTVTINGVQPALTTNGSISAGGHLSLSSAHGTTTTVQNVQTKIHSATISSSGILSLNHNIGGVVSTFLTVSGIQPLTTIPNILTATNNSPATGDVYASSVINAYQSLQNTRHTATETKTRYMNSSTTNLTSFTNQVNTDHTLQVIQNAGTTESQLRLIRNSTASNNLGLGNLSFGTSTSGGTMNQHYAYVIGKIGQNSTSYGTMKFFCLQNNADVELLEVGQNYVSDSHIKMYGTVKIDHRLLVSTTNGGEVFIGSDYTPAPNVGLGSITYGSDIANSYAYIQAKITSVTPKYGQMMFSTKINDAKVDIMTLGQTTSTDPYVTIHGQLETSSAGIKFSDGTTLTTAPGGPTPTQVDVANLTEAQMWGVGHGDRRFTWSIEQADFYSTADWSPTNYQSQWYPVPVAMMMNGDRGQREQGPYGAIGPGSEFKMSPLNKIHYKFSGIAWIANGGLTSTNGLCDMGDSRWSVWGSKDGINWDWLVTCSMNNTSVNTNNTTDPLTANASVGSGDTYAPTSFPNPMPVNTDPQWTSSQMNTTQYGYRRHKVDFKTTDYYLYYRLKHMKTGTYTSTSWQAHKWQKLGHFWQEIEFY